MRLHTNLQQILNRLASHRFSAGAMEVVVDLTEIERVSDALMIGINQNR